MNEKQIHQRDNDEIAHSLKLIVAQINMSMKESSDSVNQLIDSITAMTGNIHRIKMHTENCGQNSMASQDIETEIIAANENMQSAVIAFQFYDRLSQRIAHVEDNLEAITDLISQPNKQHPELWRKLEEKLRSVYSTEQEQTLYKALRHGISEAEVMEQPLLAKPAQESGDVELF